MIPSLFTFNAFEVTSDGWFAKAGTISSDYSRFMEWKSVDGIHCLWIPRINGAGISGKRAATTKRHFWISSVTLSFLKRQKKKTIKKMAAYHQFFAVNKAIVSTLHAHPLKLTHILLLNTRRFMACPCVEQQPKGDKRAG